MKMKWTVMLRTVVHGIRSESEKNVLVGTLREVEVVGRKSVVDGQFAVLEEPMVSIRMKLTVKLGKILNTMVTVSGKIAVMLLVPIMVLVEE